MPPASPMRICRECHRIDHLRHGSRRAGLPTRPAHGVIPPSALLLRWVALEDLLDGLAISAFRFASSRSHLISASPMPLQTTRPAVLRSSTSAPCWMTSSDWVAVAKGEDAPVGRRRQELAHRLPRGVDRQQQVIGQREVGRRRRQFEAVPRHLRHDRAHDDRFGPLLDRHGIIVWRPGHDDIARTLRDSIPRYGPAGSRRSCRTRRGSSPPPRQAGRRWQSRRRSRQRLFSSSSSPASLHSGARSAPANERDRGRDQKRNPNVTRKY